MESELKDLKEIAIAKIKAAYNRSVDLEATHSVLWDKFDKNRKMKLMATLIMSLISTSSLILTITLSSLSDLRIYLFISDIFALIIHFLRAAAAIFTIIIPTIKTIIVNIIFQRLKPIYGNGSSSPKPAISIAIFYQSPTNSKLDQFFNSPHKLANLR